MSVFTIKTNDFRRVVATAKSKADTTCEKKKQTQKGSSQLVAMTLKPGEDIGWERHSDTDQYLFIVKGSAKIMTIEAPVTKSGFLGDAKETISIARKGDSVLIPKGAYHNVQNQCKQHRLRLWSLYVPQEHAPTRVDVVKPSK